MHCRFSLQAIVYFICWYVKFSNFSLIFNKILKFQQTEAVDAEDNGVPRYDGAAKFEEGTSLGSRVSYLNPMWNHPEQELERPMRFKKAMIMAITEFYDCLDNLLDGWVVARRMTKKMMEDRLVLEQLKPFQGKFVTISSLSFPFLLQISLFSHLQSCLPN